MVSLAPGQLLNLSTRAGVLTGDQVLIAGFVITGTDPKRVIIRAIGSSLVVAGVPGSLQDPMLQLSTENGVAAAENDDWRQHNRRRSRRRALRHPTRANPRSFAHCRPAATLRSSVVATAPPAWC